MEDPDTTLAARRAHAEAERMLRAGVLLDARSDLEGIAAMAEHFRDAARWSA